MKKLQPIFMICAIASLTIFMSCGGDDSGDDGGDPIDPRDAQGQMLSGTWNVTTAEFEDTARPDWDGATVTFTYNADSDEGTYVVTGVPTEAEGADAAAVLGAEGESISWTFEGENDVNTIVREDGVEMNISSLTDSGLAFNFELTGVGSRVAGFDGTWEFVLAQ